MNTHNTVVTCAVNHQFFLRGALSGRYTEFVSVLDVENCADRYTIMRFPSLSGNNEKKNGATHKSIKSNETRLRYSKEYT